MEPQEYLESVLKSQILQDDSNELKELQRHRKEVEDILRNGLPKVSATIRYGGSKAKETLVRESYDLDVVFYVPRDETGAGESLKDIFENVKKVLSPHYYVDAKRSAIRLRDKDNKIDFHVDVVPGRFVDSSKSDCFIYQNGAEKDRLKTNLDLHIDHVKQSGVIDSIKLLKLWRIRRGLQMKQFVFELLVIDLLRDKKKTSVDDQLRHVWTKIKEAKDPICVKDPANPSGNDLSEFVKFAWSELSSRAADTIDLLEKSGWEAILGTVDNSNGDGNKTEQLKRAAAGVVMPSRPWLQDEEHSFGSRK